MNEKNTNIIKTILFLVFLGMMTLPALQKEFEWYTEKPLNGAIKTPKEPQFSWESWWQEDYQKEVQSYLKESIGFRPTFIRIHNQIYYWLYHVAIANQVVVGKEDYLYEENYIRAYLGRDFIGENKIQKKVDKMVAINDTLQKLNKSLVILFAPGKASFYPEYIPDSYHPEKKDSTNYDVYKEKILKTNLSFLDFHEWFRSMKETSPYPLMPKTGIHWSKYGTILAADSLVSFFNSLGTNKQPDFVIDTVQVSTQLEEDDDDIEKGMNLLFNIPDLEMGTPFYHVEFRDTISPKRISVVADSYYWGLYNIGISRDCFKKGQFWYYNSQIFENGKETINPGDINVQEEVEKSDVIILLSTDANLYRFAFGFVDQLYDSYYPSK